MNYAISNFQISRSTIPFQMKASHQAILADLHEQIKHIKNEIEDPLLLAEAAVQIIDNVIVKINESFSTYEFPSQEEEIHFFKVQRPELLSLLFFYNCVYKFESSKPFTCKRDIKQYLLDHRGVLKCFTTENREFYKYHNSGNTCFDRIYFIRGKHDIKQCIDSMSFIVDDRFCTNHCYLTAKILANKLFGAYLEKCFLELKNSPNLVLDSKTKCIKANWTGTKASLIELAYALQEEGAINGGNIEVKEMIELFESVFDISLGQYSSTFIELGQRKNGKTKFLDSLKEKLLQRMDKEVA